MPELSDKLSIEIVNKLPRPAAVTESVITEGDVVTESIPTGPRIIVNTLSTSWTHVSM